MRAAARDFLPWAIASPFLSVWPFLLDGIFIGATRTAEMRNGMVIALAVYLAVGNPAALSPQPDEHAAVAHQLDSLIARLATRLREQPDDIEGWKLLGRSYVVLGRFPLMMSRVGDIGLTLLWVTGLTLAYTKWSGIGSLPWTFHVKLTAVVLLTLSVGFIHSQQARLKRGDQSVLPRIEAVGKLTMLFALTAVIFAVLTFD